MGKLAVRTCATLLVLGLVGSGSTIAYADPGAEGDAPGLVVQEPENVEDGAPIEDEGATRMSRTRRSRFPRLQSILRSRVISVKKTTLMTTKRPLLTVTQPAMSWLLEFRHGLGSTSPLEKSDCSRFRQVTTFATL